MREHNLITNDMRKIIFRGKRKDNGAWVEGFYSYLFDEKANDYRHEIVFQHMESADMSYPYPSCHTIVAEVDPKTVGQFTGLTDKNEKEIYEGDIVKVHIERADFITVVTWGKNSRGWKLKCDRTNIERFGTIKYYSLPSSDRIEIIGNIHDNPELLK